MNTEERYKVRKSFNYASLLKSNTVINYLKKERKIINLEDLESYLNKYFVEI